MALVVVVVAAAAVEVLAAQLVQLVVVGAELVHSQVLVPPPGHVHILAPHSPSHRGGKQNVFENMEGVAANGRM